MSQKGINNQRKKPSEYQWDPKRTKWPGLHMMPYGQVIKKLKGQSYYHINYPFPFPTWKLCAMLQPPIIWQRYPQSIFEHLVDLGWKIIMDYIAIKWSPERVASYLLNNMIHIMLHGYHFSNYTNIDTFIYNMLKS